MTSQNRGRSGSSSSSLEPPPSGVSAFNDFRPNTSIVQDIRTPRVSNDLSLGISHPPLNSLSTDEELEGDMDEGDDADFQSHYSLDARSSSGSVDSESDHGEESGAQRPYLHHSNSSFLIANAFAPPFYNRPPVPLPPSPSLTSLLRPSFSTTTSRPTTPDSSENDTPNDTEAAVAKSARIATTVPRASPKVPTYEYYGFVLYLLSSLIFRMYQWRSYIQLAETSSHVPSLVLPPITFPSPIRDSLLSKSLVVSCHSFLSCHDDCIYLHCPCFIQYWIPDATNE